MENKYVKSTDVSVITVREKSVADIEYHLLKPEKKNFWGTVIQKYQPEGYRLIGWGTTGDFYTKSPYEFAIEFNKRTQRNITYVDGVFYYLPSVIISYRPDKYPDTYYFDSYDEAVKFAERLAGLCNLIAIFEK